MGFFQRLYAKPREFFEEYQWVPPTILLTYYPNSYLHDITRGPWLLRAKQRSSSDLSLLVAALFIIGPTFYNVLTKYSLLDNFSWRKCTVPRANNSQNCICADGSSECPIHKESTKFQDTDIHTGLSSDEVAARQKIYGPHEIWKGRNWVLWLLKFSSSASQVFILSGAILAIILDQWHHVGPISLLWLLMIYTPAWQQWSADSVVASLDPSPTQPNIALRNGKLQEVAAKNIVPGDLVHVSEGSMIPADGVIVSCSDLLQIDQSSITGDATPISKQENDICYWTTGVVLGDALLQIKHTGQETFVGRTASLVNAQSDKNATQKELASTREYFAVIRMIGIILLVLLALPTFLWQISFSLIQSWPEILSLTADMAIIAGRFFTTSTITSIRATSAAELAEAGYVSQSIKALDALAGIDTICIDNTGTLTENRIILAKPYCISCDPEDIIFAASLSASHKDSRMPIDLAIAKALKQFPQAKAMRDQYTIIDHQDIDADLGRPYTQSLAEAPDGTRTFFARGGPRALFELCRKGTSPDPDGYERLRQTVITFTENGFHAFAIARRQEGGDWRFLGVLPLRDVPRQSARSALEQADALGVRVKVMSSSISSIVEKFTRDVGLESTLLRAEKLDQWQKTQSAELAKQISESNVYTELNSQHKEIILTILQNSGHRVAVTGDGQSDVPALRKADCGIAVAGSTESAQSASELVCVKNAQGLLSLISAIKFSRRAYQHAHNYVIRQTVRTLHVLLTMLLVFFKEGKLVDLRLLLISTCLIELSGIWFRPKIADTPYPKKPARWSGKEVLKEVGFLVFATTFRTWFCAYFCPSTERLQVLSLSFTLGDLWLAPMMELDSYIWHFWKKPRISGAHLAVCLLSTAMCVTGWAGESFSMTISTATQVWIFSLITFETPMTGKYAL